MHTGSAGQASQENELRHDQYQLAISRNEYVQKAVLDYCFQQNRATLISSLVCAAIIVYGLHNSSIQRLALGWFILAFLIGFSRFVLNRFYDWASNPQEHIRLWYFLFVFGSCIGGCAWGLLSLLIFPSVNILDQLLIILMIAGVSAGAVPALAAIPISAIGFLSLAIIPLSLTLSAQHNGAYTIFAVAAIFYLLYLIAIIYKQSYFIKHAILLQFENNCLVEKLNKKNNELEYIALHDPLTEVANRHLFEINLANAIKRAERNQELVALLYIDLDNFKQVNDSYGHHIGDELLLSIADKLKINLRSIDMISRMGGDEFTVILEGSHDLNDIKHTANKISQIIAEPITINNIQLNITVSIGVSIYPVDATSPDILLKIADKAMYFVKNSGRNGLIFNSDLNRKKE